MSSTKSDEALEAKQAAIERKYEASGSYVSYGPTPRSEHGKVNLDGAFTAEELREIAGGLLVQDHGVDIRIRLSASVERVMRKAIERRDAAERRCKELRDRYLSKHSNGA